MKQYRILINGKNLWLEVDGKPQRLAFYTTRFLEAPSPDMAETYAIRMIEDDPELLPDVLNDPSDPPVIWVEEIESFAGIESANSGFTFYPEENNA